MTQVHYSIETLDRIKKLERIRALGINPFAVRFNASEQIGDILKKYSSSLKDGETSPFRDIETIIPKPKKSVAIAGRVMLHRSFGKICFATISDGTGRIQVLFSRDNCTINTGSEKVEEISSENETLSAYKFAEKLVDMGDFIGVE